MPSAAAAIVIGGVLLLFGRPLFWAFIAFVGFLLGIRVADVLFAHPSPWIGVLAALGLGLVGALLAVLAERVAFAVAGLFAGGYLALAAAQALGLTGAPVLGFAIGGAIGALLAIWLLDWAIIGLSCLVGAGAVVSHLPVGSTVALAIFLVLFAAGALFQASRLEREADPSTMRSRRSKR